jgi:acyl dehydratase
MAKRVFSSVDEVAGFTGQEIGVSDWVVVTQEKINLFAEATGDYQWIHVDAERARAESPYGATIAHGFLTLSLLSELSREAVAIEGEFKMRINYGLNRVRFPAAVRAGDRVRGRFTVGAVEPLENAVQIVWKCTVEIEGQTKPALVAEWLTRLYR